MTFVRYLLNTASTAFRKKTQLNNLLATSFVTHRSFSVAAKMAPKRAEQIVSVHDVVKSESDKLQYRGLVLQNGLKVLLVSDPETDKSAAALSVQVGWMSDPRNIPGLAHFCEHMLFLGTKKYPQENHYTVFLSNHGGMSNAYTAFDHTCYYFDVTPEHFSETADIFAQFFHEPLFTQSCTERELNAVDSEHSKNLKQDFWRLWRIQGATCNQEHDFSKFGSGSKETLEDIPKKEGIDVQKALMDFHSKYYSANIMHACLLGKENLDNLSDLAVDLFAGVANKKITAPEWPDHPFTDKELQTQIKVVPVKDSRQMVITFPVPDMKAEYKTNPSHYISHLVGHEGAGSLLSYLKRKGWVNSLTGGVGATFRGFGFFTISMTLSPEGLDHTDEIVTALFQYLELLRQKGPQPWIFDELKKLGEMQFRFKPKENPIRYASGLTTSMQLFEWKDVLSASYLMETYKPEVINEIMSYLVPEKIRIVLVSQKFEGKTTLKEKYYGTDYDIEKIPQEKINAWKTVALNSEFKLPTVNEFIPTNFSLAPREPKFHTSPQLLVDEPTNRVWFMQDDEFKLPSSIAHFELRNPVVYRSPLEVCMLNMALTCFSDANNEDFYPALLAGMSFDLTSSPKGLNLKIRGYNEPQQALLERICERLVSHRTDPSRFEILKESLVRRLKNFQAELPYQHALYYLNVILTEKYWTYDEQLAAMADCTVERCDAFLRETLKRAYLETFIYGNLRSDEAQRMSDTIRQLLKFDALTFDETNNFREHKLADSKVYEFTAPNDIHPTNSVMTFYQVGALDRSNLRQVAVNDLVSHILEEPCYNVLRTQEQLGYIVSGGPRRSLGTCGLRIIVQSDKHPTAVSERIEAFVNESLKKSLTEMDSVTFDSHKTALIALKLEKPKKLSEKFKILHSEITGRSYEFNRELLEADEIKKLTKDDVIEFFNQNIARDGKFVKQLIVKIESQIASSNKTAGVKADYVIDDIGKFKSTHSLIERPIGHLKQ